MRRVLNGLGGALCACALLATTGCDHIRDYSVNSYQGVMPAGDYRPTGSIASTLRTPDAPRPSVPAQPPEAAPAAAASAGGETTKPADSSK
ncbi:MAG TPA: hypothetical protein VM680_03855 [Verrucomicrobiae bacterium]|nr:hypothetical protein [Verrucomicrobiae bacterium]